MNNLRSLRELLFEEITQPTRPDDHSLFDDLDLLQDRASYHLSAAGATYAGFTVDVIIEDFLRSQEGAFLSCDIHVVRSAIACELNRKLESSSAIACEPEPELELPTAIARELELDQSTSIVQEFDLKPSSARVHHVRTLLLHGQCFTNSPENLRSMFNELVPGVPLVCYAVERGHTQLLLLLKDCIPPVAKRVAPIDGDAFNDPHISQFMATVKERVYLLPRRTDNLNPLWIAIRRGDLEALQTLLELTNPSGLLLLDKLSGVGCLGDDNDRLIDAALLSGNVEVLVTFAIHATASNAFPPPFFLYQCHRW